MTCGLAFSCADSFSKKQVSYKPFSKEPDKVLWVIEAYD